MLPQSQLTLADSLLAFIYSSKGDARIPDLEGYLSEKGFNSVEIDTVTQILLDDLLLLKISDPNRYWVRLTYNGNCAAKQGIEKYLANMTYEKQLSITEKESSIKGVKSAKHLSIIAIVVAITLPFLIEVFKIIINNPTNTNANGEYRQELRNTHVPLNATDTLFVKKLK